MKTLLKALFNNVIDYLNITLGDTINGGVIIWTNFIWLFRPKVKYKNLVEVRRFKGFVRGGPPKAGMVHYVGLYGKCSLPKNIEPRHEYSLLTPVKEDMDCSGK